MPSDSRVGSEDLEWLSDAKPIDKLEGAVTKPNSDAPVLCEVDGRGVAQIVLNRPERNNAYDGALIQALLATLDALAETRGLRAVVISGRGRHFQAGADLKWITAVRAASREENIALSRATAQAIWRLNAAPVPTVALVQGACFGGGTGLIAACDVVIAADDANFSIAEVRWGLTAAIIIPQLNDAIGVRQVRRYALTGERFSAAEARRIGLVHEIVPAAELRGRRRAHRRSDPAERPAGGGGDQGAGAAIGLDQYRRC